MSDADKLCYGGNTASILMSDAAATGCIFVLDAGTGLAQVGSRFIQNSDHTAFILLSNLRLYHILGFQFTPLVYAPQTKTYIIGPSTLEAPLADVFDRVMNVPYSPIYGLANLLAEVHFEAAREDLGVVQGVRLVGKSLGESWGYRLEASGSSLAYLVDEPLVSPDGNPDSAALALAQNADLLIAGIPADSQPPDYGAVLDLAGAAGVHQVVITHHPPHLTDDELDEFQADLDELDLPFTTTLAAEGMVWEV